MTNTTPPARSGLAQRMSALGKANRIRVARADLKRRVADDDEAVIVRKVIADPAAVAQDLGLDPDGLDTMAVIDLLRGVPGMGDVKARKTIKDALGVLSTTRRLGGMTDRNRRDLIALLGDHARRRLARRAGTQTTNTTTGGRLAA